MILSAERVVARALPLTLCRELLLRRGLGLGGARGIRPSRFRSGAVVHRNVSGPQARPGRRNGRWWHPPGIRGRGLGLVLLLFLLLLLDPPHRVLEFS